MNLRITIQYTLMITSTNIIPVYGEGWIVMNERSCERASSVHLHMISNKCINYKMYEHFLNVTML